MSDPVHRKRRRFESDYRQSVSVCSIMVSALGFQPSDGGSIPARSTQGEVIRMANIQIKLIEKWYNKAKDNMNGNFDKQYWTGAKEVLEEILSKADKEG